MIVDFKNRTLIIDKGTTIGDLHAFLVNELKGMDVSEFEVIPETACKCPTKLDLPEPGIGSPWSEDIYEPEYKDSYPGPYTVTFTLE